MLKINNVEISKSTVSVGETFIIRLTIEEVNPTWGNVVKSKWNDFKDKTWQKVKTMIYKE